MEGALLLLVQALFPVCSCFLASMRILCSNSLWGTPSGTHPPEFCRCPCRCFFPPSVISTPACDFLASFPGTLPATPDLGTSANFSIYTLFKEMSLRCVRGRAGLFQTCSFLRFSSSLPVAAASYICFSCIL